MASSTVYDVDVPEATSQNNEVPAKDYEDEWKITIGKQNIPDC